MGNIYNFESNINKNTNIDIRKEFNLLQKQFCVAILYYRTNKYIKCSCYDPLHKVGNPKCEACYGRGYLNTIEKLPCIYHSSFNFVDGIQQTIVGNILTDDEMFYFDHETNPKVGDLIVITKYNKQGLPIECEQVFEIHLSSPNRGDNGRVEYYTVMGKLRDDKVEQVNKTISSLDKKSKYLISKGKRYVCQINRQ